MNKDKIIRCITSDGGIMASAIDSTGIVFTAQELHHTTSCGTAALGRLLTAASMMGAQLKQKNAVINLSVKGNGPLSPVVAVANSKGNVKGLPYRALQQRKDKCCRRSWQRGYTHSYA